METRKDEEAREEEKGGGGDSALLSEKTWVDICNQRPAGQVGSFAFEMSEGWSGEGKQQAELLAVGEMLRNFLKLHKSRSS